MFNFVERLAETFEDINSLLNSEHKDEITKRGVALFKLDSPVPSPLTQDTKDKLAKQMFAIEVDWTDDEDTDTQENYIHQW